MLGMSSSNEDAGGSFDMVEEVWWSGGKVYGNEGGVMMRWIMLLDMARPVNYILTQGGK